MSFLSLTSFCYLFHIRTLEACLTFIHVLHYCIGLFFLLFGQLSFRNVLQEIHPKKYLTFSDSPDSKEAGSIIYVYLFFSLFVLFSLFINNDFCSHLSVRGWRAKGRQKWLALLPEVGRRL